MKDYLRIFTIYRYKKSGKMEFNQEVNSTYKEIVMPHTILGLIPPIVACIVEFKPKIFLSVKRDLVILKLLNFNKF